MGKRVSFSFRNEEEELHDWMERQHEEGNFRTRTDVIITALKQMRDREVEGGDRTEWKA